jgi:FlaA1/EpsC-like NDP-sugar epimerase
MVSAAQGDKSKRTALVTGAGGGIGLGLTRLLAAGLGAPSGSQFPALFQMTR